MAAQKTRKRQSWSVLSNGAEIIVEAEVCSIGETAGTLIFDIRDTIVRAFGPTHWSQVRLIKDDV